MSGYGFGGEAVRPKMRMVNPPISTTVEEREDGSTFVHYRNLWWQPGDRIPAHRMETSLLPGLDCGFPLEPEDDDKLSKEEVAAIMEKRKEMEAQLGTILETRMKELAVENAAPVSPHAVAACSVGDRVVEMKCGRAAGKKAGVEFVKSEADALAQALLSERKEAAEDSSEDDFQVSSNLPVFTNYNPALVEADDSGDL